MSLLATGSLICRMSSILVDVCKDTLKASGIR